MLISKYDNDTFPTPRICITVEKCNVKGGILKSPNKCILLLFCKGSHRLIFIVSIVGYEPADHTVHPPPQKNYRGWVHFFRIGV